MQDGQIKKHWNRPYAADGFCQVNPTMNEALKKVWQENFQQWPIPPGHHGVIDLFGGNGNLSQLCAATTPVLVVDAYPVEGSPLPFIQADLYAPSALALVQAAATTHQIQPPLAWLILDPPRSGHQQIALWAQAWRPQNILYVSCNAATLARDLTTLLPEYRLHSLELFDFFPGTYHFETMAVLTRKN
ncbi:MAG: hypothetical protein J6Y94_04675 [Bacteriovoracaceae bacterium]|nr:hypothetical protein [Bacteriovoracaceae bacterium]